MLTAILLVSCFIGALDAQYSRIVGGSNVNSIDDHPWQASLRRQGSHICGAAFISYDTLVTAAHCVDSTSGLSIGVGHHDRREHQELSIASITQHPEWNRNNNNGYPNDIAVIKLRSNASESTFVKPVQLASSTSFAGKKCTITGWGRTSYNSGIPYNLQEVDITVVPNSYCDDRFAPDVNDGHICVEDSGKSACSGDSGGPLVCPENGKTVLAGVTSWGNSYCQNYPSVYTRITYFKNFINENL